MINKVILIGNVGADPEIRTLEGGIKVARIRIATTERIYNRTTQEAKEHTEWHSVTLWRNMADVADRFVRKGSQVYIEGRIRSRDWTDEAGAKRYAIEIVADDMKLLGRRPEGAGTPADGTTSYGGGTQGAAASAGVQGVTQGSAPARSAAPAAPAGYAAPTPVPQPTPTAPALPSQDDPDDLPF